MYIDDVHLKCNNKLTMTIINTTTLRNNLSNVIEEIKKSKEFMLVTNRGKITSALVDIDLFEDLLARSNKKYLKSIENARKDIKEGKVFSHEEVFGEL